MSVTDNTPFEQWLQSDHLHYNRAKSEELTQEEIMTWITPNYQHTDFSYPLSLDDKITIFTDAVRGWQLDIADQCINGRKHGDGDQVGQPIKHAGFAALHIVMSYFETIARYESGSIAKDKSKKYFKHGLVLVFPELTQLSTKQIDLAAELLYDRVRNGLYHTSRIRPRVLLTANVDRSVTVVGDALDTESSSSGLTINPHLLTKQLLRHLEQFEIRLRDPENKQLRINFERRFDFEASR